MGKNDPYALAVKLADNRDNSDEARYRCSIQPLPRTTGPSTSPTVSFLASRTELSSSRARHPAAPSLSDKVRDTTVAGGGGV